MLYNGINASAIVSVPLLGIADSPVFFSYVPGTVGSVGGAVSSALRKIRFEVGAGQCGLTERR